MRFPQPNPVFGNFPFIYAAIIGGGNLCYNLLRSIDNQTTNIKIKVLGVADVNPEAPGLSYAKQLKIFTSGDFHELLSLDGLNVIIDLSGRKEVEEELMRIKPLGCSVLGFMGANLILNLIQAETQNHQLKKESKRVAQRLLKDQIILDSMPYRLMIVNPDFSIDNVNQAFMDQSGLKWDDIKGKRCYEVRHGLDRPCRELGRICYMEECEENNEVLSNIYEYENAAGEKHFDFVTFTPITTGYGEMLHLMEASQDMTDRINWEQEAHQSSTFLQNVIRSTVDGIVVVDTKGKVLLFNEGMERLTGYSAKELVNKGHLSNFYDMDTARENMRKMRSDEYGPPGVLNPTSMSIETKDGQKIPVTLSASIIEVDGEEIGSVGVFTDMREIEQMRKELDEAHLQLVQSEKIASVGRMAAGVAHEINNPLSIILMFAELLEQTLSDNPRALPDLKVIIEQTLRSKEIVADLLEFSRKSLGKASSFSLRQLIEQCLNLLINLAIFHDIKVVKDINPDMPEIWGDVGQLEQVFTNLFNNAADAMEGNGRLSIKADYNPKKDSFEIRISDTGPGIPLDHRNKIFDMFFTTKRVGYGTGLGLSISKNIIELHGGKISFKCPPGGGTTFVIELPRIRIDRPDEEPVFIGMDDV